MELFTNDDILAKIKASCAEAGSQRAWAERLGLSASYVTDVLKGRRRPGGSMLDAIECERVEGYRKKRGRAGG